MPSLSKSPRNPSRRPGGARRLEPAEQNISPTGARPPRLPAHRPAHLTALESPSIHAFIHSFAQHKDSDAYCVPGIQTHRK